MKTGLFIIFLQLFSLTISATEILRYSNNSSTNISYSNKENSEFCKLSVEYYIAGQDLKRWGDSIFGSWNENDQEEFIYYLDANGVENTVAHYNLSSDVFVTNLVRAWDNFRTAFEKIATNMYGEVDSITWSQLSILLDSASKCHTEYLRIIEFNPCEKEYQACRSAANDWYEARLEVCFTGGLSLSIASGGLGLGLGVGCIVFQGIRYNRKIGKCIDAYNDCTG